MLDLRMTTHLVETHMQLPPLQPEVQRLLQHLIQVAHLQLPLLHPELPCQLQVPLVSRTMYPQNMVDHLPVMTLVMRMGRIRDFAQLELT